jgi:cytochrome c oxidase subunit 3
MSAQVSPIDEVKSTPWSGGKSPFNVEYGKMMMWFFLLSDAFTFSSLLISYGALRFSSSSWPAPDKVFQSVPGLLDSGAPLVFVGLMTFILILSSVTMVLAVEAGHRMAKKEVLWWMVAYRYRRFYLFRLPGIRVVALTPRRFLVGNYPKWKS